MANTDPIDRRLDRWVVPATIDIEGQTVTVAFLVRSADHRPLVAPWWRGKESYLIGGDVDGNFFLRHSDGSVRYWEHASATESVVARSVREFVARVESP